MRLDHLRAFLWLRWRLGVRQVQRGGMFNTILVIMMAVGALFLVVISFFVSLLIGMFAFERVDSVIMMLVWDAIIVVFLMAWMVGLLSELQRTEAWSIDKFLHLPVSLRGLFLLNYLSSLLSLNLCFFVPTTTGLTLGLAVSKGAAFLLGLPLLCAFFFMVTALTYQFQGWLASLMTNERRRRTIITVMTIVFIAVFQLPNLINVIRPWDIEDNENKAWQAELKAQTLEWNRQLVAGEITAEEMQRRQLEFSRQRMTARKQRNERMLRHMEQGTWIANVALPPGWLALGLSGLTDVDVVPALLGTLGLAAMGIVSLWRAYRTTLRLYTGDFTAGQTNAPPQLTAKVSGPRTAAALERTIPCLGEQASAVAFASLRSLSRAPEAKMLMLMPIIMALVFGSLYLRGLSEVPVLVLPLISFGVMALMLVSLVQFVGNQFGFDRSGFRAFVLSPVPRRDILLGKNLAAAPVAIGLCLLGVSVLQLAYPQRLDRYLALIPQAISMFVILCTLGNWLAIFAPWQMPTGALKPTNTNWTNVFYNMQFLGFLSLAFGTTLLPIGVELGLEALGWAAGLPIALVLSLAACVLYVLIYRAMLSWQGRVLQGREQQILEIVTTQAE